jgi:hypothetical protein
LDTPEGIDVGLIRKELLIRVLFFARVTWGRNEEKA